MNYQPTNQELRYIAGNSENHETVSEKAKRRRDFDGMLRAKKMFQLVCELEQPDCSFCCEKTETMCSRVEDVRERNSIVPSVEPDIQPGVVFVPLVVETEMIIGSK